MKYTKAKAVIFDVDGTLLDSMEIWDNVGARYLHRLGIQAEEGLRETLFPMSARQGASYLNEHYQLHKTESEVVQGILETVRDFYYHEAELKEGVRKLLAYLDSEGIPMAIATSSERQHIEHAFERLGIRQYFQVICTCFEENTGKKESPLIYQKASEYLKVAPEKTYVFEDVLYAVRIAKKAGYRVAAVYDSYSAKDQEQIKELADIYLHSLADERLYNNTLF